VIVRSGTLPLLRGHRPGSELAERFQLPVYLCNDAKGMALAYDRHCNPELWDMRLYLHDTGLSSCHVYGDRLQRQYIAEECGHELTLGANSGIDNDTMVLSHDCGTTNCFESRVCEWGILERWKLAPDEMSGISWRDCVFPYLLEGVANWQSLSPTPMIIMAGSAPWERPEYIGMLRRGLRSRLGNNAPQVVMPTFNATEAAVLGARAAAIIGRE
jgi:predicted NBD/HSP70 family sugar kinase